MNNDNIFDFISTLPEVVDIIGYGSGVKNQEGYTDDIKRQIDLILTVNDIYEEYEAWCKDNAVNYNRNMIRNTIIEKFEMKVKVVLINGKSTRCFVYNVGD